MIEVYPNVFVKEKELRAHDERMAQEAEASKRPDVMSRKEEEEWDILEKIRGNVMKINL